VEFRESRTLEAEVDAIAQRLLNRFARTVAADAFKNYPRSPAPGHHTADTIRVIENRVYIGDGTPTWFWVEYGTPAHWILPRRKQALFWDGAIHPVRRVWHPGTRELAPMRKALYQRRRVILP